MLSNTTTAVLAQEESEYPETERKVGVEIVRSADLASRFFHGPRRGRAFPIFNDNEFWAHRLEKATR